MQTSIKEQKMPQDKSTVDLQKTIREKQNKLSIDNRGMYSILLGRPIVETMISTLGEEGANDFLAAHTTFDRALEKNKTIDLFELVPVHEITAFKSFNEYVALLRRIHAKLKMLKEDDAVVVRKALETMLELAQKKQAVATASEYGSRKFWGTTLPAVPLNKASAELLPYSYPDFDAILGIVTGHFNKTNVKALLVRDLNAAMKKSLKALAMHRKYVDHVESDYRDYLIEAQKYLIEHNWLKIGIESDSKLVSAAVDRGATVSYDPGMEDIAIACIRTSAYTMLGVNLEFVLRRAIYSLFKDVIANYMIDGRQVGLDVTLGASSYLIQETAKTWLKQVHEAFNKANEAK
jgi:hypothetical protein